EMVVTVFRDAAVRWESDHYREALRILDRLLGEEVAYGLSTARGSLSTLSAARLDVALRALERCEEAISRAREVETALLGSTLRPMRISEAVERVAARHDIDFMVQGDGVVMADEALDLVLDHLVQNAVVHGGTRKIDFRVDPEECLLTVADHGRGIEDHLKERVFEEGFRRGDGPGMGLFLVRGIVERYGGSVWVEDNFPRGAAFRLRFPNFEKD
ncbi:MAG: sensor histidine kinase, partial [Thermoplasmatota archaeon]